MPGPSPCAGASILRSSRAPSRQGHHQNSPKRNLIFRRTLILKTQICLKFLWVLSKINISEIFSTLFSKIDFKMQNQQKSCCEMVLYTVHYSTCPIQPYHTTISHLSLSDLAEWLRTYDCQCQSRNRSEFDPIILRHRSGR